MTYKLTNNHAYRGEGDIVLPTMRRNPPTGEWGILFYLRCGGILTSVTRQVYEHDGTVALRTNSPV